MKRWTAALLFPLFLAAPLLAEDTTAQLLKLLVSKQVISSTEAAQVFEGDGQPAERLVELLQRKGVLSAQETAGLLPARGRPPAAAVAAPAQPAPVQAGADPLGQRPDFGAGQIGASVRAVAPRPQEPLPIAASGTRFVSGPLAVRLGSGVTVNPYGMVKVSAVYDSNLSSGDDFPFFARVIAAGPETANTTGTIVRPPDFRVKARSARMGVDILAPDPNEQFTISGKLEFDFEGSFPSATNRNIGALRASQASIRSAFVRLDAAAGGLPVYLKFGQDATLYGSSTQPTGLETTGNYIWQGNVNERAPGIVAGTRFDLSSAWLARLAPEFGVFLPSAGEYVAEVIGSPRWGSGLGSTFTNNNPAPGQGTVGFGQREGTNSARPRYEGRLVLEFEPWRDRRIAPSQVIASFQSGERVRYFAPPFQTAGRNFALRSNSAGYTGEARLVTPWWALVSKYYRGSDLRYYFGGLAQDVFFEGGDPFTAAAATPTMRPVRAQGGFAQLQLPLSVWFNPVNPLLHGFSMNLMAGYDSAFARDARRAGQRRAQGALMGNFLYQYNRYVQFGFETDFIQTFYTSPQGGIFDAATGRSTGPQGRIGRNLRFEFGTTFMF